MFNTGGGVHSKYSPTFITESDIAGNTAGDQGGGVYYDGDSEPVNIEGGGETITIEDSTISSNIAGNDGSGIYHESGTLILRRSTVSRNTTNEVDANNNGGGIYNWEGTVTISDSVIADNEAEDDGGGIFSHSYTLTVTNSTISGNTARSGEGGGIFPADCHCQHHRQQRNERIGGRYSQPFQRGHHSREHHH
jgi:hypothetical protein